MTRKKDPLLAQIEAFMDRHFIDASPFGVAALGDPAFVKRFRGGSNPHRRTKKKVLDYMAAVDAGQRSPYPDGR